MDGEQDRRCEPRGDVGARSRDEGGKLGTREVAHSLAIHGERPHVGRRILVQQLPDDGLLEHRLQEGQLPVDRRGSDSFLPCCFPLLYAERRDCRKGSAAEFPLELPDRVPRAPVPSLVRLSYFSIASDQRPEWHRLPRLGESEPSASNVAEPRLERCLGHCAGEAVAFTAELFLELVSAD